MLNPIERAQTPEATARYRLEPYAIAGDIGSVEPHVGRGGWSWSTGSAAWCWRLGVEAILGLRRVGDGLRIEPHIAPGWSGFESTVRTEGGVIEIAVDNTPSAGADAVEILVDGARIEGTLVALPLNGETRQVTVRLRSLVDPMMKDVGEPLADSQR
jgi:cyclic beta-1,2-glucan synthetase